MNEAKRKKIQLAIFQGASLLATLAVVYYFTYIDKPERFDPAILIYAFIGSMGSLGLEALLEGREKNRKRVFIVYDQNDKEFALALSNYLSINKTLVYDENKIVKAGDRFNKNLRESILNSDSFIIVLSENLLLSDFLKEEISVAEVGDKKIIPVIKDDTVIPGFLSGYKPLNFKRSDNGSLEFEHLLSAI
jgi:hypothetical protein